MSMPRPDEATRAYFQSLLPEDPRIAVRPMFGNLAGFVNGNMFTGIFGSSVFVRLPAEDRAELLANPGAALFAPMEGRPMTEYVTLPHEWRTEPERARAWLLRSLAWAADLPPKEAKKKKR
jgi:TfoX/Sxy family transcriptional regulator of competence genes